ncbi:hypothetical protein PAHAL_5G266000 [Panicum hallii]|uniref:Uncharacterized protein n=1 Tax=Panicum hallii TaxID=206008 RepID=A0A2T8ILB1_9POAL|nr:hypothetical protein PAHAL_5G266000 [Panicum hallii]
MRRWKRNLPSPYRIDLFPKPKKKPRQLLGSTYTCLLNPPPRTAQLHCTGTNPETSPRRRPPRSPLPRRSVPKGKRTRVPAGVDPWLCRRGWRSCRRRRARRRGSLRSTGARTSGRSSRRTRSTSWSHPPSRSARSSPSSYSTPASPGK